MSKLYFSLFLIVGIFIPTLAFAQIPSTTVEEILANRDTTTRDKKKPRYCSGGVFKPCVCARDVTKRVQYRPKVKECGDNAAIILNGRYASAFSAVIRDLENADRIPSKSLINGCTVYERDVLGLNKCSVYKAQKVMSYEDDRGVVTMHCLGAAGDSVFFNRARRITVKLSDRAGSNKDPIARLCLRGPTKDLN